MANKKITQQEAYHLGTDHQFVDSISLGPWTTYSLLNDPKHMGFVLARYKFPAKMFDAMERVIEVGCGDAFGTPIVAQHVKEVVAIEPDARHIESNKKRLAQVKNIQFQCGTIQDLKFPERSFCGAYSIDVIEHLDEHLNDPFVESQAKILKKDGVCIIGTPNKNAEQYASERSRVQHINLHTQKSLKELMEKYFSRVFMFGMNDEVLHTGYAPMCHYILGMGVGVK
ncbi:MAG: class I SAM-dependent methyltransferase [Candidatus Omnitrophica bacterium]|nr:class I SAM-dependent methyltransferase [Candidatus Omnitrophota bacterium]